jgi:hypothetical protein
MLTMRKKKIDKRRIAAAVIAGLLVFAMIFGLVAQFISF